MRWLLALVWLLVAPIAAAQTFPALTGRVVDDAQLLSPAQVQQITDLSAQVEQASGRQLVVATIPSLQGYPIEDYGYQLGRAWKIGEKGANNGVILIVAPNERQVRVEVGYGLEPIVTDALSSVIVNQTILPRFRDDDMAGGIVAGAQALGEQLKLPTEAAEQRARQQVAATRGQRRGAGTSDWVAAIFWTIIILFIVIPLIARRVGGRRYRGGGAPVMLWGPGLGGGWGGGGSSGGGSWGGGGGFSGGGGSFGGGGASGSW